MPLLPPFRQFLLALMTTILSMAPVAGADDAVLPEVPVENAGATTEQEMKPYTEVVRFSEATIELLPIAGGTFTMGSPDSDPNHQDDESPQHEVQINPFWMGKHEITWDAYEVWMFDLDIHRRKFEKLTGGPRETAALEYQISQPTPPYCDMTFGMGRRKSPAISMTQFAARTFCQWLSLKTGRYYRLPTEAEWEYACRAGTTTAYSFGDDASELDDYAWHYENSDESYQKVGRKKPNPWGLHDMHGNVAEWVLDQYDAEFYGLSQQLVSNPLATPLQEYPRIVRGGSWYDDPDMLRSAARDQSTPDWKMQDPQLPKSIWYHTDATHVGFRVVRPLHEPTGQEQQDKWDKNLPQWNRKGDP